MTPTQSGSRRDAGVTAMLLGFFAATWFGWAQAGPPEGLRFWLAAGSIAGWLVAVAGAIIGFRAPRRTSALYDRAAGRRYGILVGVEFAVAGLGAAVLGIVGQGEYIPAWICVVVGVHFFPLAPLLRDRSLHLLGAALCAVTVVGMIAGMASDVEVSTVVGVGAGIALLGFAVAAFIRAWRLDSGAGFAPPGGS